MTVKQLSIFVENRKGRLGEVLGVLKQNGVSILSMSLADTTEYGLLRLIVNDPEKGRENLLAAGFSSMVAEVLIIKIPHRSGSLQEILSVISEADVSIEYMYGLSVGVADACVVMKTGDLGAAMRVLSENRIETVTARDLEAL